MISTSSDAGKGRSTVYNIFIASFGNALEWFDFVVYGFFAPVIAKVFFPTGDQFTSLLLATASFGVPFLIRPLGALVIGRYADRAGRKPALTLTVLLMLVGTLIIALTPSFATIGVFAPALVVLARFIQGFSAGGEFGSAAAYLTEQSTTRRGYFGSWQFASQSVTSILAAGVVWAIYANFTPAEIQAWAWRLPFLFGLLIGPVGLVMRRFMRESEEFIAAKRAPKPEPPRTAAAGLWRGILATAGLVAAGTVSAYVLILYLPTFAITQLHLPPTLAQSSATIGAVLSLLALPLAGALSDRVNRLRLMQTGLVLTSVAILPLFAWLLANPSFPRLLVCQLVMALTLSLYTGPLPALMAEVFPLRQRTFGMSVGYNLAVVVFGGFSPMVLTALIHETNSDMAPAWYVLMAALISIASISSIAARRKNQAALGWNP